MTGEHANAVAGPSTFPSHPPVSTEPTTLLAAIPSYPNNSPPLLFLPPPLPPPPKQHLASTQDLLARFHLLSAYDRYVRPLTLPGDDPSGPHHPDGGAATPGPSVDKGKGREREGINAGTPIADADAADGDDDDAPGAKGEKKKKNSYKHLIKGVPGKHSLKKDDYLTTMMLVPPKQRTRIHHFDVKTQEDAFAVSLEGLKGWNVNALFLESAQAREDRKKRKELKRLAKLQGLQGPLPPIIPGAATPAAATSVGTPLPSSAGGIAPAAANDQPIHAPIPVSVPRKMSTIGTPKPAVGTPRPGSRAGNRTPITALGGPPPGVVGHAGAAVAGYVSSNIGVPRSTVPRTGSAVPRPGSAVPRPGSAVSAAKQQQQRVATPMRTHTPMDVDAGQRGQKRIREDGVGSVAVPNTNGAGYVGGNQNPYAALANGAANGNGSSNANGYTNGIGTPQPRPGVMNAKAGTGNIRPRPVKKQRMDVQGQSRDVSQPVQQQPTPQGV